MGKRKTADKVVEGFIKRVRDRFDAEMILWFGSRAKGEALKTSDYDFLIVSKTFEGISFPQRMSMVYREVIDLPASFDILCYTPEEFDRKKKKLSVVREALREGIIIFDIQALS